MYYYKIQPNISKKILYLKKQENDYADVVLSWLKKTFKTTDDMQMKFFVDVPDLTSSIIQQNEWVEPLLNKTNNRFNKRHDEAKRYIQDWIEHKKAHGYDKNDFENGFDQIMMVRELFPSGSVSLLYDNENGVVYSKTSKESNSSNVEPITLKEYNLKEIDLLGGDD